MKKENIIQILAKSHAIKILSALDRNPMRFTDLKEACKSNRTRSARLRELEGAGLIKTIPKMIERRAYTFYEITPSGKEALKLCEKLICLQAKQARA